MRGVTRPPLETLIAASVAKFVTSWYLVILVFSTSNFTINLE